MARTLLAVLNESNPNKVSDALHAIKAGDAFALLPSFIAAAVVSDTLVLPTSAKAMSAMSAFATAGGAPGALAFVAGGAPVAGEFSVSASGDIVFAAADAVTAAEVVYFAVQGEVFTETVSVAASAAPFSSGRGGVMLLAASVGVGLSLGAKTPVARGSAPAAGEAALSADGLSVAFNAADVVIGSATLTYAITPGTGGTTGVQQRLLAASNL
jgi:hypothetical protein